MNEAPAVRHESCCIPKLPKTFVRLESMRDIPDLPNRYPKTLIISLPCGMMINVLVVVGLGGGERV